MKFPEALKEIANANEQMLSLQWLSDCTWMDNTFCFAHVRCPTISPYLTPLVSFLFGVH